MTKQHLRLAGLAAVAGTLAAPAVAAAHPAAWEITPKVIPAGQTPNGTWTQANLQDGPRQVAAYNHNNTKIYVESNGKTDQGLINFRKLPGAYRSQIPFSRWYAEGGTGIQIHATCEVPALTASGPVERWQPNSAGTAPEPFFSYVPFQPQSAQLDDDPALWIPVVRQATGVDLTGLTTAAQQEAACEALPGATADSYRPADTISSTTSTLFTFLTTPLQAQVTSLTAERTALTGQVATLNGQVASLTGERDAARRELAALRLASTTLKVVSKTVPSLDGLAASGHGVTIEGPATRPVQVRLVVSDARRRAMKLQRRVLGSVTTTLGADAKGAATVSLGAAAVRAVKASRRPIAVTIEGRSGDRFVAQTVTLQP